MAEAGESKTVLLSSGKTLTVQDKSAEDDVTDDPDNVKTEIVPNLWGSCAGVGSDFLDKYRKNRTSEMARLEEMDKKWREDMENKIFQSQRNHRIKKELEKMQKRKQKREKKKKKSARQSQQDPGSQANHADGPNSDTLKHKSDGTDVAHDRNCGDSSRPGTGLNGHGNPGSDDDAATPKSDKESKLIIRDLSEDDM